MTTSTLTVTEFLLARIAEDEAVAKAAAERAPEWHYSEWDESSGLLTDVPDMADLSYTSGGQAHQLVNSDYYQVDAAVGRHIARHDPARVLAECAAKRRRIDALSLWAALCPPGDGPGGDMSGAALADAGRHLLRIEALPYAAHPDYRPEWAL